MLSQEHAQLVSELQELVEEWSSAQSYTGDPDYDTGIENAYNSAADQLNDIINRNVEPE